MMGSTTSGGVAIRPLDRADVDWYAESLDAEIVRWSREEPITDLDEWWNRSGASRFVIECCGEAVGAAKVAADDRRVEISYWIAAPHRGHGYAGKALIAMAAEIGLQQSGMPIELEIHPQNEASIRTAVRAGFAFDEMRASCDSCADDQGMVAVYRFASGWKTGAAAPADR